MTVEIGDVFGKLTVIGFEFGKAMLAKKVSVLCECGVSKQIRLAHVVSGITVSCGCVKQKHHVTVGKVYGRLTVIDATPHKGAGRIKVLCRCQCGTVKLVDRLEVSTGGIKSCGCLVVEQVRAMGLKHGGEGSPLYSTWHTLKVRCNNANAENFHNYGGRGIAVCDAWQSDFAAFRDWSLANGYKPGLEIDRIDVNGDYEPDNCRWTTDIVNANNRRNNVLLTAFGETMTMSNWARDARCAVSYPTLKQRIYKGGFTHEAAICQPSRNGNNVKRRIQKKVFSNN